MSQEQQQQQQQLSGIDLESFSADQISAALSRLAANNSNGNSNINNSSNASSTTAGINAMNGLSGLNLGALGGGLGGHLTTPSLQQQIAALQRQQQLQQLQQLQNLQLQLQLPNPYLGADLGALNSVLHERANQTALDEQLRLFRLSQQLSGGGAASLPLAPPSQLASLLAMNPLLSGGPSMLGLPSVGVPAAAGLPSLQFSALTNASALLPQLPSSALNLNINNQASDLALPSNTLEDALRTRLLDRARTLNSELSEDPPAVPMPVASLRPPPAATAAAAPPTTSTSAMQQPPLDMTAVSSRHLQKFHQHQEQQAMEQKQKALEQVDQKMEDDQPRHRISVNNAQKWYAKYEELVEFVKEHGHSLVPVDYRDNPSLSNWVKRQRYQYKLKISGNTCKSGVAEQTSTLTAERQKLLEDINFCWDSHSAAWEERWGELQAFKLLHNHCNVPINYAKNPSLGIWVKCQRRQFKFHQTGKHSNLTPERIEKLTNLGFVWTPRQSKSAIAIKDHKLFKEEDDDVDC